MEDPYKTLGIKRDASQDDIRNAYLALAKRHHPDLNPGNARAEEKFKTVSAANHLLSDPETRGRFDRGEIDAAGQERAAHPFRRDDAEAATGRHQHRSGPQPGPFDVHGLRGEDLGDILGDLFDRETRAGAGRGQDQHYLLTTAFLDAVNGATRRLSLPDGRTLDVRIPPGTVEGQVLRLRGQGGDGARGMPAGDALIDITVASHPYFRRHGQDIRLDLPVTLAEAVLGGPVEVPTPGGPVRMRIPPGSDNGTELRLRGRGVPAHGDEAAGQLYATLRVIIGPPDAALEQFLRGWKPDPPVNPRHAMAAGP